jgi:hypothetical protein
MTDADAQAYGLPPEPNPDLRSLDGLVGTWELSAGSARDGDLRVDGLTKNRLTPSFEAAERVAGIVTEAVGGEGDDSRARSDQPESDLPAWLSKPARRALAAAGYARREQLTEVSEAEVMKLHGMGPKALDLLRRALAARDQRFAGS